MAKEKRPLHIAGFICGFTAIGFCIATIGLAIVDIHYCIYTLTTAILFLAANRIFLHLTDERKSLIENILVTIFVFIIAILVSLTKFSIYFLISGMFCYSLTIIAYCIYKFRREKSAQLRIFHILCIILAFLYSFIYFFPAIYAKHASTVSNSHFIVLCFTAMIIVSSSKNLLFPYHKKLKLEIISNIIRKTMVNEILLALLILIFMCSIYFTVVEPDITSFVDALWYSFSVVTTIGFGDVFVVTTFGRIISVILGISGIAVVAVFTSVIVNFYNEMSKRREERAIKKLVDEAKELEKIEEEIIEEHQSEE